MKALFTTTARTTVALALIVGLSIFSGQPVLAQATLSANGTVEAVATVPLTFGTRAVVSEVLVEEGQFVHQGDVLARLDTSELELAIADAETRLAAQQVRYDQLTSPARDVDIAAAQAALNAAQANANAAYASQPSADDMEIARLQVEQAQNQLWQAQLQRDTVLATNPEFRNTRTNSANAQEIQLNSGLDQAALGINIAQANYAGVQNQGPNLTRLGQANASITQAQIQLDLLTNGADEATRRMAEIALESSRIALDQTRLGLEDAELIAPFDGLIVTDNLVAGEQPPANQPALELADTSAYVLDLAIDETDVVQVQVGQAVMITFDALPDVTLTGTITEIGLLPIASEAVPTYSTRVTFDPGDAPVRIGMSATANIAAGG